MNESRFSPSEVEHDARMRFDELMHELVERYALDARAALALVRRIARDGNGWR